MLFEYAVKSSERYMDRAQNSANSVAEHFALNCTWWLRQIKRLVIEGIWSQRNTEKVGRKVVVVALVAAIAVARLVDRFILRGSINAPPVVLGHGQLFTNLPSSTGPPHRCSVL